MRLSDSRPSNYRNIGLDLGTMISAIHYTDFRGGQPVFSHSLRFPGANNNYVPTLIYHGDKTLFGWEAENVQKPDVRLFRSGFKMDLLDPNRREAAKESVRLFYRFMYGVYSERANGGASSGQETDTFTYATCPVKFSDELRGFLREAICDAGFPNVTIISEAEAAMCYACNSRYNSEARILDRFSGPNLNIMSIDMGAGTTDVSVFEYDIRAGYLVRMMGHSASPGLSFVGSEIERRLVKWYEALCGPMLYQNQPDLPCGEDPELGRRILIIWTRSFKEGTLCPRMNTGENTVAVPADLIPILLRLNPEAVRDIHWGREQFEVFFRDYLDQLPAIVQNALDRSGRRMDELDAIVLTGGNSNWYFVEELLAADEGPSPASGKRADGNAIPIIRFPGKESIAVAIGASLYRKPNLSDRALSLRKTDLPGAIVLAKAYSILWRDGITNLRTGESVRLPAGNPHRQRWKACVLRYGGSVFHGHVLLIGAGSEKRLVILTEEKTLVFSNYRESLCRTPAEWLNRWFYDEGAYGEDSKLRLCRIATFECRSEAGEVVRGYRFDRDAYSRNPVYIRHCEKSCYVFTDAVPGGFFSEGLCPALNGHIDDEATRLGYIGPSGAWAVSPEYLAGMPFYRGVARVMPEARDENGRDMIGAIDYTGKGRFRHFISEISLGMPWSIIAMDRGKKYFLMDNRMVWCVEEDEISGVRPYWIKGFSHMVVYIRPPSDGKMLFGTSFRNRLGYIDPSDTPCSPDSAAIPEQYEYCRDFHEGVALLRMYGDKWGLIDHSGREIAGEWDALYICPNGIVIGRRDRFFRGAQWSLAEIRPNLQNQFSFHGISRETAMRHLKAQIDSSETELMPPWIAFPDADTHLDDLYLGGKTRPTSFAMFQTDENEFWQSYADGYYTVLKDGHYSIYRHDGSLLTRSSWAALWLKTDGPHGHPMIGHMTDAGWTLFHRGVLCVYDGEHWGLLSDSGEMLLSPEWDTIHLYESIIITGVFSGPRHVIFDYSGRNICESAWTDYRYDGVSDYLSFAEAGKLCILNTRNGEITRTDYPGSLTVKKGAVEREITAFTAVHSDMLAVFSEGPSFAAFIDPKGRKIFLADQPKPLDPSVPIHAKWAGKDGHWYLYTEQDCAVWIVEEDR